jgi:hypothetical protein
MQKTMLPYSVFAKYRREREREIISYGAYNEVMMGV